AGKPPIVRRWVRMRAPPARCKPQALFSTPLEHPSPPMLPWFGGRWTREVPGEEARAPLGMAPQRQWHDRAIARPTPALVRLSSSMPLTAHRLLAKGATGVRRTAWERKTRPTFSAAMAWVRRQWWDHLHFSTSRQATDMRQMPRAWCERFMDAVC